MEILNNLDKLITTLLSLLGTWGAVLGCVFILFESILPVLPLSVFITLNFLTFGKLWGFIISWIFTVLGCMLSYYIFRNGVSEKYLKKLENNERFGKLIKLFENIKFSNLVTLIAIPFAPAFLINIAAGICRVDSKKYFMSLLIGKIVLVYFWGYIGVSFLEALKNPEILIKIAIIVFVVFAISKLLSKKLNIE